MNSNCNNYINDKELKKDIQVTIFTNFKSLASIETEWDSFIENVDGDIFLTFDWCRIWWNHYGNNKKLRIFVLRKNTSIVGIIPLFVDKIRLGPVFIKIAKIVGVDYTLNTISLPLAKDCFSEVVNAFIERIVKDNSSWDMLYLGPISGLYKDVNILLKSISKYLPGSHKLYAGNCGVQTCFRLITGWNEYLQGLGSRTRRNIRRSYRQASANNNAVKTIYASEHNFEDFFNRFVTLHQSRWEKAGQLGHFKNWPKSYAFHHDVAEIQLKKNRLRLMEIRVDKLCIGFDYSYKLGNNLYDCINARSLDHKFKGIDIGKLLWCEILKKAFEDGIEHIDYMRGKYTYKALLGAEYVDVKNIYITPRKRLTFFNIKVFLALSYFLNVFYYKIWCQRISVKLRIKRKPLWDMWIRTHWFGETQNEIKKQ